jgi:FPC/CPF motif-containing protein YcgG
VRIPHKLPTGLDLVGVLIYAMKGNPFDDPLAMEHSSLHLAEHGKLKPFDAAAVTNDPFLVEAHTTFRDLVLRPGFSCVGAKAAFNDETYAFGSYPRLGSAESTAGLCRDLCHFSQTKLMADNEYATFIAVFREPRTIDPIGFEQLLWRQLEDLHEADAKYFSWDASVSADPKDARFSFSFAGRAFYVIGMHEQSSRSARRYSRPALVFNPHEQFERLRMDGKWQRMQRTIRAREMVLQGSVNPMLSDFGEKSEARQYSGRAVAKDWTPPASKCPFGH